MDVWIIYTKEFYEKKVKNGTFDSMINYAKQKHNMNLSIFPDYLFSIICDGKNNKIYYDNVEIIKFPKIVFFKKYDLYLSRQFELLGITVLNSSESMNIARNKLRTYQLLTQNRIKIPKTIYFSSGVNRRDYSYNDIVKMIGSNIFVVKPSFGSKGKDISLIKNELDYKVVLSDFKGVCLFQEFIDTSKGKDIRSYVINGEYLGSAVRTNEKDFRTNYNLGAKVLRLTIKDENVIELSKKAANAIGIWYSAVDILFDGSNYYVCEVNSIPGKTRKINSNCRLINRLKNELDKLSEG